MAKKKKSNRTLYIIVGFVVLLLIFAVARGSSSGGNATKVEISKVDKATIVEKVSASGTVQSFGKCPYGISYSFFRHVGFNRFGLVDNQNYIQRAICD